MTLRVEMAAEFWFDVLSDPVVTQMMGYSVTLDGLCATLAKGNVLPLAAQHGGFWFIHLDPFQRVCELHTMFTPAGWGREVHGAAKEAFTKVFTETPCVMVITHEMRANPKSQPPRSFGFEPVGDFAPTFDGFGEARTWVLTYEHWFGSPAGRRQCQ